MYIKQKKKKKKEEEKKENCILRTLTAEIIHENKVNLTSSNWPSKIKELLEQCGFYDAYLFPESVLKSRNGEV